MTALQNAALEIGVDAVVEVGPHPALAGPIRSVFRKHLIFFSQFSSSVVALLCHKHHLYFFLLIG